MLVMLKVLSGGTVGVEVPSDATAGDLKATIQSKYGAETSSQKLVYAGSVVDDAASLEDLGVVEETAIMLVLSDGAKLNTNDASAGDVPPAPASSSVAAAGGGAGGASGTTEPTGSGASPDAAEGAGGEDEPGSVALNVRLLSGATHTVDAACDAPIREIKPELARVVGVPTECLRLVYSGAEVDDERTPAELGLSSDSVVHVIVRFPTKEQAFLKVISSEGSELRANCPFCHTAGATFEPRPLCARCSATGDNNEAILVTEGAVTKGVTTWGDLLGLQVQCFGCGISGRAAVGFLCTARTGGAPCVSRTQRRLQYVYDGSGDREKLFRTINTLLGYAHAGGLAATL